MSTPRMPGGPRQQPGVRPANPGMNSARHQGPPPRPPNSTADLTTALVSVGDVGAEREAHRQAIADQNKQQNNKQQRLDPEMTFEVTFLDESPLHEYYREAAALLGAARK